QLSRRFLLSKLSKWCDEQELECRVRQDAGSGKLVQREALAKVGIKRLNDKKLRLNLAQVVKLVDTPS
ncbi:MAG: hypothetical protein VXZ35_13855, partial [Pseudomonadota bacterium]|nr:hypothetical protein [Pseudomonadota bacterium]